MLDEKDLQAIAGLINQSVSQSENRMKTYMDEQITGSENRMNEHISGSENRMKANMDEQISGSENRMNEHISGSEDRMKTYMDEQISGSENRMNEHISGSENRIMAYIESNVEKKIQLLAEGHRIILDRLPEADEQGQLKSRVKVLERVVTDLRVDVDELQKAQ